ncbi:hypothetical protein LCGC14_1690660 [marine sediment metagenome]|uniref:Uncharacterized protein n=1 Tax=marine sediment metagenome TaxID=412755 RepID=A0A0F9I8I0_9ZZZZ
MFIMSVKILGNQNKLRSRVLSAHKSISTTSRIFSYKTLGFQGDQVFS